MSPIVAIAGTGVKQRVSGEQCGLFCVRQQADMAHRMTGCVQAFKLYRFSYLDNVASANTPVDIGNTIAGILVRNDLRAGCLDHALVAACMVSVLVCIEYLRNRPATILRDIEALRKVEWINCQCLARFRTRDEIIEVPIGVSRPDLFDDHSAASSLAKTFLPPTQVSSTTMSSISEASMVK